MDVKERFTDEPTLFQVRMPDGTLKPVSMYRHYNYQTAHISETFDKLLDYYYEVGAAKMVKLGAADCILCEARKLYDATVEVLKKKEDYFIEYQTLINPFS